MTDVVSAAGLGHVSELGHVTWPAVVVEVLLCVCCVLGGLLNSMILLLFARRRSFRTLSNRWELELAISKSRSSTSREKKVLSPFFHSEIFISSQRHLQKIMLKCM